MDPIFHILIMLSWVRFASSLSSSNPTNKNHALFEHESLEGIFIYIYTYIPTFGKYKIYKAIYICIY